VPVLDPCYPNDVFINAYYEQGSKNVMWKNLFRAVTPLILSHALVTPPSVAPERGALVIVGGAMQDSSIMGRFIELAGGPEAPIVIIPSAGAADYYDGDYPGTRRWRDLGTRSITVVHTRDRKEADSESFVEPIRKARGVWFPGGRQWRLADTYLGTRTEKELHKLLERGGVIGGSSAGASIQGSYLVRGDTETNAIVMGDHEQGFGFLKNVAIDQHLLARNRHFDLIPLIEENPQLLGIGLAEDTAIVVQGNKFEVMGKSVVAIYDYEKTVAGEGRFYFLRPGDSFNLVTRQATRRAVSAQPFNVVTEGPWPDHN
jgi:cyanophycinase